MHKSFLALLVAVSSASAQRLVSDPGFARLPGPALRIADSTRIDIKAAKLEPPMSLFAGPKGGLVVYWQWAQVIAFDSSGRRLWSQGSDEKRDIGEVSAFGWRGNEMWVSDAAWTQVAVLDQFGNVTRSIELPDWVRPTFSNRKSFPVFESLRVFGRYDDGSMLVIPRGPMSIAGATAYDEKMNYVLRVDENGLIQRTIAKVPSNAMKGKTEKGREFNFTNPLHQWYTRITPDGMRTMVVSVDTTARNTDTVVVRALNEKGDTLFTQKFAYPSMTYTPTQIDSIARFRWGNDTDYREARAALLPRRAPTVVDAALDPESKSLWITLRGNNSTRPVVGFDGAGKPLGKLLLPSRRSVKATNAGAIWVAEFRNDQRGDLVRYRLAK